MTLEAVATVLGLLVGWVVLRRWILPRLGVPT